MSRNIYFSWLNQTFPVFLPSFVILHVYALTTLLSVTAKRNLTLCLPSCEYTTRLHVIVQMKIFQPVCIQ